MWCGSSGWKNLFKYACTQSREKKRGRGEEEAKMSGSYKENRSLAPGLENSELGAGYAR